MVIHIQEWEDHKNIIIVNEKIDSSVQLIIYNDNQEEAFLYSLYVATISRRCGYADYLMTFAEKKAREMGWIRISLRVCNSSPRWLKDFCQLPTG